MLSPDQASASFKSAISHFQEELKKLRAGRATPDMFANVEVEAYGSRQKLSNLANINVVDATLVNIQPWDKTLLQPIAKSLQTPPFTYNPQVSGDLVRIPIPAMTQEKRLESVKQLKEMAEQCRIQVRVIRKDVMSYLDQQKKDAGMPEDTFKSEEKKLQAMVDDFNKQIEDIASAKEDALMTV